MTKISNYKRGFTLIELIVVMAVFLFIIGAAIGIFLSIVQNQKKVLSQEQFLNQISYVEEYMSKALRMAKTAETTSDISCLGNKGYIYKLTNWNGQDAFGGIKFINQSDNNTCQEFLLQGGVLYDVKGVSRVALTSSDVIINFGYFIINGVLSQTNSTVATDSDGIQPRVTILLNVNIPGESDKTIQTTVSRRNLNVP